MQSLLNTPPEWYDPTAWAATVNGAWEQITEGFSPGANAKDAAQAQVMANVVINAQNMTPDQIISEVTKYIAGLI